MTEKIITKDVSIRLKKVMEILNISLKDMSEKSGVPYRTLQSYIMGKSSPTAGTLNKLSEAFNIDLNWLINGEGLPIKHPKLPLAFVKRLEKDMKDISFIRLMEEIPFFTKVLEIIQASKNDSGIVTDTLLSSEIAILAKVLNQPEEEYLQLANLQDVDYLPESIVNNLFYLSMSNSELSPEELNDLNNAIDIVIQGYFAKKRKEQGKKT